jgi:hypothetical protein
MGAHVTMGGQYFVGDSRRVAITFGAGYHFARLNNFTGALGDSDGQTTDSLLVMRPEDFGEVIGDYPAAQELPYGYRTAIIDFRGFRAYVGFTLSPCTQERCNEPCNCLGVDACLEKEDFITHEHNSVNQQDKGKCYYTKNHEPPHRCNKNNHHIF